MKITVGAKAIRKIESEDENNDDASLMQKI
jgi:hypothetical protein